MNYLHIYCVWGPANLVSTLVRHFRTDMNIYYGDRATVHCFASFFFQIVFCWLRITHSRNQQFKICSGNSVCAPDDSRTKIKKK